MVSHTIYILAFTVAHMYATGHVHLIILKLINLITFGEYTKSAAVYLLTCIILIDPRIENNTKDGHCIDLCITITFYVFCSPAFWKGCSEQNHPVSENAEPVAKILLWPMPHSYKKHVRTFQMAACISHTWDCLLAHLNRCQFKLNDNALLK
jgi:hypothetical protein